VYAERRKQLRQLVLLLAGILAVTLLILWLLRLTGIPFLASRLVTQGTLFAVLLVAWVGLSVASWWRKRG
jgi:hypothetical protein